MNSRLVTCAACALGVHGFLLFGLHLASDAVAFTMSDQPNSVEVALVEEVPPPEVAPPPPPPPQDEEQPPPPEPTVEPMQAPEPPPVENRPPPLEHPNPKPAPAVPHPPVAPAVRPRGPQLPLGTPGITAHAQYRSNPKPDYPAEAKRLRQEGVVMVNVSVNAEGRVTDASLAHSSGFPLLDQAALQAVHHWTFEPARAMGIPVASKPAVPIRFKLPPGG